MSAAAAGDPAGLLLVEDWQPAPARRERPAQLALLPAPDECGTGLLDG